ncbi:malonate decarboxylase holo-ACP synthase [Halobacillus shinanisalinarum]|uniref:Malonate decarboxylase holo-ACP synthase n=1 Tax=Halobacillus shinanisalinarum TaxID=2932258 RepID=A0ABY4GZX9_9BACI|nr:malonate decarboxylase holo-ACP synthase [Halobacillus shinanisalinarum]UOQ92317.1 malonate decarboxylase holo-ACP synthase [Halobacillus shinanisalinarum]
MVISPHDLLRIREGTELTMCSDIPEWVTTSLQSAPFAVVRRAPIIEGKLAIGVRGSQRNQRFGTYIRQEDVLEHIPPNQIVKGEKWLEHSRNNLMPAIQALEQVNDILHSYEMVWGPAGSVGFELVSRRDTVTENSDLDIVVYAEDFFPIEKAETLVARLSELPVVVDVQVETPNGAISLREYARNEFPILLKTKEGPKLVNDPWNKGITKEVYV